MTEPATLTVGRARLAHQWPAFDGLRAVAILAVMAYHVNLVNLLQGGYVGVDLFFVLSGFLITWLLITERDQTSTIRYSKFYARRALRLFPALVAMVVVVLLVVVLDPGMAQYRHSMYLSLPFVVFYSSNWVIAFTSLSTLGILSVTWSLAVEEQYYLVWPVVLSALSRRMRRITIVWLLVALAGAEVLAGAALNLSGASWLLPYFSTATHSDGLLVGSAVALWWSMQDQSGPAVGLRRWSARLGSAGLAVLAIVVLAGTPPQSKWTFAWITTAVLASAAVIFDQLATPTSWRTRLFCGASLQWIGRRSYGLYLWHVPVLAFLGTLAFPPAHRNLDRFVLTFALTFPLAAFSYRVIELPFLRRKRRFSVVPAP